ncbi:MAG TPA: carboxypeptidase-like regulatory domain-containing protein, partial [Polyangiaceae bacterium]
SALSVAACSVGGSTVSLGGSPRALDAGAGGADTASGGALNVVPSDVACANGKKTTVSGTVYDPAGQTPLYNAVVYIADDPGKALPPFASVVACEECSEPVPAKAVALSGPDGRFVLEGVPSGPLDLVIQIGKWRRKTSIPSVIACQDNPLIDPDLTRLPRNHSEGDIPKIALSTGHSDALECLLRKIGIDDSEFSTDSGAGRVNMFVGCVGDDNGSTPPHFGANQFAANLGGQPFPSTNRLFDSGELSQYDVVIFSCEGHKCDTIQTPANVAQLVDYENRGGRVFLDHDHYNWLNHADAPIEKAAQFSSSPDIPSPLAADIYTSEQALSDGGSVGFPKGDAFAQWLYAVHASATLGVLNIYGAKTSCESLDPNRAQNWIYRSKSPAGFFYFTIGTPVAEVDDTPAPEACGRVVFTDLHVSAAGVSADYSDEATPFPLGCVSKELTPQELALEFMIFDLSSCVQQETAEPTAPPPR